MRATVASVRARLLTALDGLLGTYRAPNGSTVPALRIEGTSTGLTRVPGSGAEVEIHPDVNPDATPYYNRERHLSGFVELRVVGHDKARLDPITTRILRIYPHAIARYVPGDEQLGILNQATIRIPTN